MHRLAPAVKLPAAGTSFCDAGTVIKPFGKTAIQNVPMGDSSENLLTGTGEWQSQRCSAFQGRALEREVQY